MKQPTTDGVRYVMAWTQAIFLTLLFSNIAWIPYAQAEPQGGTVTGGSGSISQSGNQTTINQNSQNMAIDWQSYNLSSDERVQYIQPNSSSISLNRILSNGPSLINGRIDANGQVILINPNGVFFTSTSVINVGGIVASGLDMTPTDFMNGNYIFNEVQGTSGLVVNGGIIKASTGGNVTLLGKRVRNDGVIVAKLGAVNLAAGKEAVLTFDSAGLIGIGISKAILQDELGIDPAVLNNGTIDAEGGRVLLTASASRDIFSQVLDVEDIRATSVVVNEDGSFILGGADVVNTGTIDVSTTTLSANDPNVRRIVLIGENVTSSGTLKADNANGNGGEIELHARDTTLLTENSYTSARSEANGKGGIIKILGDKVGLIDQAIVDVSGANGGGTALIGGDQEGKNILIRNATYLYLGEDTQIKADALDNGDGGKLIAFASDSARIYSALSARGGMNGGNGGFIETSGLIGFDLIGAPDVSAVAGTGGEWLIDPYNVTITGNSTNLAIDKPDDFTFEAIATGANVNVADIYTVLRDNGDVTIKTSTLGDTGTEAGNITWNAFLDFNGIGNTTADRTLTLQADGDISFGRNRYIHDSADNDENLSVNLYAKGAIILNQGVEIETRGGNFTVGGIVETVEYIPTYFEQGGNSATIDTQGSATTGDGNVTITTMGATAGGVGVNLGTIDTGDGNLTVTATGGTITQSANTNRRLNINGTTSLTALGRNVSLTNASNDFNRLNVSSATASIRDVDRIRLGTSTLTGTAGNVFTVTTTDGDIEQLAASTITVSGNGANVQLTAGGGGNDITQGSNAAFINNGVGSLTTLTASRDTITLDNTGNDFTRVTANANNITLRDANNIELGVFTNSQNNSRLTVTTVDGTITQAAQINYTGDDAMIRLTANGTGSGILQNTGMNLINNGTGAISRFSATGQTITLEQANDFTTIEITAGVASVIDVDDIDLGASNVTGDYSVTSGVINGITQSAGLTVGGQAMFTLVGGTDSDISLGNADNDFNNISIVASAGTINDVTVTDTNGLALDALTLTGDLTINANAGGGTGTVTDNGAISVAGLTTINAGTGNIVLDTISNNFNRIDVTAANAELVEAGDIELGNISITGTTLQVTALGTGNISQATGTQIENVNGTTVLTADGNDITLENDNNDFGTLSITQAATASIVDSDDINLGTSNISNRLNITSGGNITNTGGAIILDDSATASFTVGDNGSISLTDNGNRFTQPVSLSSSGSTLFNVAIHNSVATEVNVGDRITGDLRIDSRGAITSSSALLVDGTATLLANGQNITLTNAANDFNIINVDAANRVDIRDTNAITIGGINANTVNVNAGQIALGLVTASTTTLTARSGQITDNNGGALNIMGDTATLDAANGVGAGDPLETRLANLMITNASGGIGINNTGNVTVNMRTSGNIDFTNTGDVYIDLMDGIANGDTHSHMQLTVINGSVFGAEPQTLPDIRGHDVTVIVNDGAGDFGTAGRPIYLDIHGVFTLLANISAYDFYGSVPSDIVDNSSIKLSISSLFTLLSSQKLIEIESLFDLDPAIFTEVRNYYHDDLAIMMPLDQMYSDEEEEERRRKMSER